MSPERICTCIHCLSKILFNTIYEISVYKIVPWNVKTKHSKKISEEHAPFNLSSLCIHAGVTSI